MDRAIVKLPFQSFSETTCINNYECYSHSPGLASFVVFKDDFRPYKSHGRASNGLLQAIFVLNVL